MLRLVLILPLVYWIGQAACQIVFQDVASSLREGDPCFLTNGNAAVGQCRKITDCGRKYARVASRCAFSGNEPIICCDVLQKQCESIVPSMHRITDHIVGNALEVRVGEFPFVALVLFENPNLRCGASLVASRFLLTAAHCVRNANSKPTVVKLGTIEAEDPGAPKYNITQTIFHERYQRMSKINDLAVIELEKDVTFNSLVKPICLYTKQDELPVSVELTAMGWGVTNTESVSNALLKGTVRPIRRADCQARFDVLPNKRFKLSEKQLCALGDKNAEGVFTDSCGGDSGGPLVLQQNGKSYLVGVTSTGSGCGSNNFAGIYTRVNTYLSWIVKTVVWD